MKPFSRPAIFFFVFFIISGNPASRADTLHFEEDPVSSRDSIVQSAETDSGWSNDSLVHRDEIRLDSPGVSDSGGLDSAVFASDIEQTEDPTLHLEEKIEDSVSKEGPLLERSEGVSFESFSSKLQSNEPMWLVRTGALLRRGFSFIGNLPPIVFLLANAWKIGILIVSFAVILFTIMFFRRREDERRFMTTTRLSVMDKEVQRACKHMERYFDDPNLNLESLCRSLVTGPAFMEALFQREMGMRVEEFLSHVRMNRARKTLNKEPAVTVDELSRSVGISDPQEFENVFRRLAGVSLDEYRSRTSEYTTQ